MQQLSVVTHRPAGLGECPHIVVHLGYLECISGGAARFSKGVSACCDVAVAGNIDAEIADTDIGQTASTIGARPRGQRGEQRAGEPR